MNTLFLDYYLTFFTSISEKTLEMIHEGVEQIKADLNIIGIAAFPLFCMLSFTNFLCSSLSQAVKLIFAFAIFITYALQAYVPVDIIWNTYMKKRIQNWDKTTMEYLLRIAVVLVTCKYNNKLYTIWIFLYYH